jgi:hypothetical protein
MDISLNIVGIEGIFIKCSSKAEEIHRFQRDADGVRIDESFTY